VYFLQYLLISLHKSWHTAICVWFTQWKHNDPCLLAFPHPYVGLLLLHSTWTSPGRPYELNNVNRENLSSVACNHRCTGGNSQRRVFVCDLENLLHLKLSTILSLINIQYIQHSSVADKARIISLYQQSRPNYYLACYLGYSISSFGMYYLLHLYNQLGSC
jgi:hypothetical protein